MGKQPSEAQLLRAKIKAEFGVDMATNTSLAQLNAKYEELKAQAELEAQDTDSAGVNAESTPAESEQEHDLIDDIDSEDLDAESTPAEQEHDLIDDIDGEYDDLDDEETDPDAVYLTAKVSFTHPVFEIDADEGDDFLCSPEQADHLVNVERIAKYKV